MEWLNAFLHNWVLDAAHHWLLASSLGFVASWWMLTTFYAPLSMVYGLLRLPVSRAAIYGILICCLLAGLSLALLSHSWLDGFATWYRTPLGPPLNY
jgi:hypothetical protein